MPSGSPTSSNTIWYPAVGGRLAKDIGKHIVQLDVGNGQAVLGTVLFPGGEIGQLQAPMSRVLNPVTLSLERRTTSIFQWASSPWIVQVASKML